MDSLRSGSQSAQEVDNVRSVITVVTAGEDATNIKLDLVFSFVIEVVHEIISDLSRPL